MIYIHKTSGQVLSTATDNLPGKYLDPVPNPNYDANDPESPEFLYENNWLSMPSDPPTTAYTVADNGDGTGTYVADADAEALKQWEREMELSDSLLIPRWFESHLDAEYSGVSGDPYLQQKYDDKKALRALKPDV